MSPLKASEKGEIKVGRFVIPYRIYGNGKLNLVCVNGVQQSMAMWHSFVERFSSYYKIVLFDFPGQGRSSVVKGPVNASINEQVEILKEVISLFCFSAPIICSASWGGVAAMLFAAKYPQDVSCLVLAGMGTRPNKKMVETIKKGCNIEDSQRQEMAEVLIKSFGENLPQEMKERILKQFCAMSKENLRAFCEHGMMIVSAKGLEDIINLKDIKVKTILLTGEKDTIIDLEDVKEMAKQIPACRVIIIKGVGHFLHLENKNVLDVYGGILSELDKKI